MKINIQKIARGISPFVVLVLIISLSISVFAAEVIDWRDFVDYVQPGIDYDINDVFVPPELYSPTWFLFLDGKQQTSIVTDEFQYEFTEDSAIANTYLLYCSFIEGTRFPLSAFEDQESVDFYFFLSGSAPGRVGYRYSIYYYDSNDNRLGYRDSITSYEDTNSYDTLTVSVDLDSFPAGTEYISFRFSFAGSQPFSNGDAIYMAYMGLGFQVITPGTVEFDPIIIQPDQYLVSESSDGTYTTLHVSVPADDLTLQWHTLRGDDYSIIDSSYANPWQVTLDAPANYQYWIDCLVYDKLDITDIVNGSTMTVDYHVVVDEGVSLPMPSAVRYQVRYFDSVGNLLDNVNFFTIPDAEFYDETKLELVIDKPDGAVSMSCYLQYMDIAVVDPISFELYLDSINFACDIPTIVRVQQETGRTNKLLEELIKGDPAYKEVVDQAIKDSQANSDKIHDSIDKIEQLPKPEINLEELVPDELAGQSYLNFIAALRPAWDSNLLVSMATFGLVVMIFSYLLFGKKG